MKESSIRIFDFFKNHKYGKLSLIGIVLLLVVIGAGIVLSQPQDHPIALSNVAAAISAGRVMRIEDSQDSGSLTIYYKDGTQPTARRDKDGPLP